MLRHPSLGSHSRSTLWGGLFVCFNFLLDIFFIYISNAIPKVPYNLPSSTLLPNPPTLASWPRHFPVLGHITFTKPRSSPPNDGQLGHLLLLMQLATRTRGVLVSSYCCSSYRVTDSFSSSSTFSSSSIGDHGNTQF